MAITIQIYERTGPSGSPTDTLVTNMNWKSQSLNDDLYKYYYFPVRIPTSTLANYSVPKYLYARISGSYASAKRVRWKLVGPRDPGGRILFGTSDSYATPTPTIAGNLTTLGNDIESIIVPKLSTVGPTSGLSSLSELATNTTYYTNFLVTQFMLDSTASSVGNSEEIGVLLILDEYE